MHERRHPLLAALSFLTAAPVGRRVAIDEHDLRRGAVLFPIVGAALGFLVAATTWAVGIVAPHSVAAVLGVAVGVIATAALHLDGLGDVADAVGASLAGRNPRDAMSDPRLGTFGAAAVVLDLLLKVTVLSALTAHRFPWTVVAAYAISRTAPIALASRLPYAGGGTSGWTEDVGGRTLAAAALCTAAVAIPSAGFAAIGMAALAVLVIAGLAGWSRRHLGGVTGDVFGAAIELTETLSLLVAVIAR